MPDIPLGGIISIIHRTHLIFLNAELKKYGITASGFLVLMHFSQEQNVIQDDLARRFHIDKSAIARAVQKLESAGFVRRIIYTSDRQASHLIITQKGNEIIPEIIRIEKLWKRLLLQVFARRSDIRFILSLA